MDYKYQACLAFLVIWLKSTVLALSKTSYAFFNTDQPPKVSVEDLDLRCLDDTKIQINSIDYMDDRNWSCQPNSTYCEPMLDAAQAAYFSGKMNTCRNIIVLNKFCAQQETCRGDSHTREYLTAELCNLRDRHLPKSIKINYSCVKTRPISLCGSYNLEYAAGTSPLVVFHAPLRNQSVQECTCELIPKDQRVPYNLNLHDVPVFYDRETFYIGMGRYASNPEYPLRELNVTKTGSTTVRLQAQIGNTLHGRSSVFVSLLSPDTDLSVRCNDYSRPSVTTEKSSRQTTTHTRTEMTTVQALTLTEKVRKPIDTTVIVLAILLAVVLITAVIVPTVYCFLVRRKKRKLEMMMRLRRNNNEPQNQSVPAERRYTSSLTHHYHELNCPHPCVSDTEEGGAYRVADVTGEEEDSESTAMIHHYSAADGSQYSQVNPDSENTYAELPDIIPDHNAEVEYDEPAALYTPIIKSRPKREAREEAGVSMVENPLYQDA